VVRALKLALPLTALGLAAAIFLVPRPDLRSGFDFSSVRFDAAEGLRLINPRFTGRTYDGGPFILRADWALPDSPDPTSVGLGPLTGEFDVDAGRLITLQADGGEMRPKDESLRLDGRVRVAFDGLYDLETGAVDVDLAAQTLRAAGPVAGRGPEGDIAAGSMRAARRGESHYVWFEDRVRVRIDPTRVEQGRPTDGD
jgi:lipopolysaccharide export system protein LptC